MYYRETSRIGLRRFELTDSDFVLALWNDKDYVENVADRGLRTIEDAQRYLNETMLPKCTEEGYGPYLVVKKDSGVRMGFCGIFKRPGFEFPDVGYAFLPEFRKQGYAQESASILEEVAKNILKVKEIYGFTSPNNAVSKGILLKLGLQYRKTFKMEGYDGDTELYSKLL